ncbi:uncharacterized protein LACBIDRAFT_334431 [Laccaria bicolor S238N-H82]|uniref:Predicted protein n=1 Tax=Laccaria bicolor (strain S238N-H82 / ATCC MYA-4686) TaxID=486041 RepID=B0DZ69_LACBS|nr:uncharacterized protein LACBIDRAFT_334430 [Laccaria bicolor S238N-H82]XP_001889242.1 uncharacterized protein LACBIDRAFT_334431 [Laccaria bicolor S238N-H82]EDR00184.1 predicted protein [Laccaria bicolor S238N-H82]EDR00185.1 predicted protein [Laccaria bicolor S238N-H82]|eukprot:XP_001889241.1 predicted protein [Laccaria bicolor S238N-H82]
MKNKPKNATVNYPNGNGASKRSKKSQAMVESEDEGEAEADVEDDAEDDADAGPSTKSSKKAVATADKTAASPPPAKKAKRDWDDDADEAAFALQTHFPHFSLLFLVSGASPYPGVNFDPPLVPFFVLSTLFLPLLMSYHLLQSTGVF